MSRHHMASRPVACRRWTKEKRGHQASSPRLVPVRAQSILWLRRGLALARRGFGRSADGAEGGLQAEFLGGGGGPAVVAEGGAAGDAAAQGGQLGLGLGGGLRVVD